MIFQFVPNPPAEHTGVVILDQAPPGSNPSRARTDSVLNDPTGYTREAKIYINPPLTDGDAMEEAMSHEIGHLMGLGDCPSCATTSSIMSNPGYATDNTITGRPRSPTTCDQTIIKYAYLCNPYITDKLVGCVDKLKAGGITRGNISPGTFPDYVYQNGQRQTQTHGMSISDYNPDTGNFKVKFTDYTTTTNNPQTPPTFSSAGSIPYAVADDLDACINFDGTLKDVTNNLTSPPTFGCSLTKNISLTFVGTEKITFYTGASGNYIKVYSGTTTPGSGVPYMHFVAYSLYNNQYSYATNGKTN